MRELAKSMIGLSWAVSFFGVQQLSKAIAPSTTVSDDEAASEIDDVSRAVQSRLSGSAAEQFRAADEWQRRVVDAVFDAASMRTLDPLKVVGALNPGALLEGTDPRAIVENGVSVVQKGFEGAMGAMWQTADVARRVVRSFER